MNLHVADVSLTDAGRLYLEQVRTAFGLLDDAERDVLAQDGALAGRVRLSVPTTYGHYRLPPVLARFAQQYPQVQVELNITNRNVDLVAEGFDLAIRLGQLPDSGLVGRKLEDAPLVLVASPEYLERRGTPQMLDDLQAAPVPALRDATHRAAGAMGVPRWRARRGLAAAFVYRDLRRCAGHGVAGRTGPRHLPEL
ncbi:LysR family transcriptional regulator [Stenotrophomonas maltophilia]|uniref:LysR family transcriptional regulator n=1 Tax=Stenotrophomonas maltophilia TaxID=40324 RepID=UPI0023B82A54|nr:LysR family transcriptional regulator [Stenotrophomonas maltophilia]